MAIDPAELTLTLSRRDSRLELDLHTLQGLWTEAQYLRMTEQTNHLIEFTDGAIEVLPMPTSKHQIILLLLYEWFKTAIAPSGGKVLVAPLRLQIRPGKFREPDVLLLLDTADPRYQNAFWLGADLVVEVVSPDDPERDLVEKVADYAEAGIPEYWIVNPIDETITVLTLAGDAYTPHDVFPRGTHADSLLLADFSVSVDAVFDAR